MLKESPRNKKPSFLYLMMVPVITFFLGLLLITGMNIEYNLMSLSITTTLALGIAFALLSFLMAVLFSRTPAAKSLRNACRQILPIFQELSITQIVVLSLSAGISEELLFRGFLQQWLWNLTSLQIAVITTSVVFGLLHFLTLSYFLLATTLGLALGITYVLTNSLIIVMIWHGVYDIIAVYALARHPEWLGIEAVNI